MSWRMSWRNRCSSSTVLVIGTSMSKVLYCTVYSLSLCSCIGAVINAMRASESESSTLSTPESG
jgi:hypothetical protein